MARFPRNETDICILVDRMISGFTEYVDEFPSPPFDAGELEAARSRYADARSGLHQAMVALGVATKRKKEALHEMVRRMKANLRYAENRVDFNDVKLWQVGWSAPRARRRLEPPGQVLDLNGHRQGPGWITLEWQAPPDGGKVHIYQVERTRRGGDRWQFATSVMKRSVTLENQERGVEWIYRVRAINRAGEGMESNIVTAVL